MSAAQGHLEALALHVQTITSIARGLDAALQQSRREAETLTLERDMLRRAALLQESAWSEVADRLGALERRVIDLQRALREAASHIRYAGGAKAEDEARRLNEVAGG